MPKELVTRQYIGFKGGKSVLVDQCNNIKEHFIVESMVVSDDNQYAYDDPVVQYNESTLIGNGQLKEKNVQRK